MSDIFISYTREDREAARRFATALIDQGYSVWWDPRIPIGKVYGEVIQEALNETSCVVVLWSKYSVVSHWVLAEVSEGADRKILIPVQISKVKPPIRFRIYETVDLEEWSGDPTNPSFTKLIEDIGRLVKPSRDTKAEARQKQARTAKRKAEQKTKKKLPREKTQAYLKEEKTQWPSPLSGSKAIEEPAEEEQKTTIETGQEEEMQITENLEKSWRDMALFKGVLFKGDPLYEEPAVNNIFISYRREDTADFTGRIYDRLSQHFGEEAIFIDVDKGILGLDEVSQCKVLLAVIGRRWLTIKDNKGGLRLQAPTDFLRIEIESALRRNIPVIPLLVHGVDMPSEDKLPKSLRELAFRHGTPIRRNPDFHKDMDRLIKSLEQHLQALEDEKGSDAKEKEARRAKTKAKDQVEEAEHKTDRHIDLSSKKITDADLKQLPLTGLTSLDLHDTNITDAGLKHLQPLTELTDLDLRGTKITDAGLKHLQPLTNLTNLRLRATKVTEAGMKHLKSQMPGLGISMFYF